MTLANRTHPTPFAMFRAHWPEFLMEAAQLGTFMVSACTLGTLLEHPASPVRQTMEVPVIRRMLMGIFMGLTAIALIYSPWGRRSGAHLNPAVTFTFWRLGKIDRWDAAFYTLAQCAGGITGVMLSTALLGPALAHLSVDFVITTPGPRGTLVAWVAEMLIAFVTMLTVLTVSNHRPIARYTGLLAGILIALYITFEAPLSGMSMNPARTLSSALFAGKWTAFWVYLTAPLAGMALAATAYTQVRGARAVLCAKLHHSNHCRCIFCGFQPIEIDTQRRPSYAHAESL